MKGIQLSKQDRRFLREFSSDPENQKWWNLWHQAYEKVHNYFVIEALLKLPVFNVADLRMYGNVEYTIKGNQLYFSCNGQPVLMSYELPESSMAKNGRDILVVPMAHQHGDDMELTLGTEYIPKTLSEDARREAELTILTKIFCETAGIENEDEFNCALYPILKYGADRYVNIANEISWRPKKSFDAYFQEHPELNAWEFSSLPYGWFNDYATCTPKQYAEKVHQETGMEDALAAGIAASAGTDSRAAS